MRRSKLFKHLVVGLSLTMALTACGSPGTSTAKIK